MNTDVVISVKDLFKTFTSTPDRPQSLKSYLVNLASGKPLVGNRVRNSVLQGVSFEISRGEIVGLMGRNGIGKSTLFRILSGIYQPDSGKVQVKGRLASLISLGAGFHGDLTGYENIFLNAAIIGFSRREILNLINPIVEFSELGSHIHKLVKQYSSGMQMRLAFSVAVYLDAPIILLDEVLGVGDEGFQKKSLARLKDLMKSGKTVIIVTHDPNSILNYCTRCILLDQGKIIFDGPPPEGVKHYSALFS